MPANARKVNPSDIPAGHVELGGGDRLAVSSAYFQESDPEAFIGRTVKGRYVVTELLGGEEGSYAFLADDKLVHDKKVLVRMLIGSDEDEILGSILAEERVSLSHVSHPSIARLIDSGQFTDGIRYVISEYVDALSVSDILNIHGKFPAVRASRIIKQVASALTAVHQEGILHRDVRPSNIIVAPGDGEAEQVTLVNFGASAGEPTSYNYRYKSPEVLEGRVSTIASDVYSLAVVAYEMLTGELPFPGKKPDEVARRQRSGMITPPSTVRTDIAPAVDRVLNKALAYSTAERYPKARDLGDALYSAISEAPIATAETSSVRTKPGPTHKVPALGDTRHEKAKPAEDLANASEQTGAVEPVRDEPAWTRRSPEPPELGNSSKKWFAGVAMLVLLMLIAAGWFYMVGRQTASDNPPGSNSSVPGADVNAASPVISSDSETPPAARTITQPPNSTFYQNSRQNLKGDLYRKFVGFSLYYPKDWKVNGPQESGAANTRGKFLDISSVTSDGFPKEQMLISYYPSRGTFNEDADKFKELVGESNDTLKKIMPGYQLVSEGETKINGGWRAYEMKFQAPIASGTGDRTMVWGRRLFIPAARPGVRDGFEITMLATSAAESVHSVDDVGVRGELSNILYSFEPSQNF
jgi:serine/threonine protein kinase